MKDVYNNSGWKREYVIKDHLGNTRLAYCDLNNDGVVATPSEILQENHYDAYGYDLSGVYINHSNADNLYQYNACLPDRQGKEKQDDHGIGMYDYSARFMDPSIGRFITVDALASEPEQVDKSPYAYAWNNPVNLPDPDGNCPKCAKAIIKTLVKSVAKGKFDASEIYDVVDAVKTVFDPSASFVDKGLAIFDLVSPVSSKEIKAGASMIEKTGDAIKGNKKARDAAKTGQEAHRQIQKELKEKGADTEVPMTLKDGTKVRKDAVMPDGSTIIIKPNTPSGQKSAKKREELMQKNEKKSETVYYDPSDSKYQPSSSSYIGPKKNN